mmetsp:Transcript_22955/g.60658  ORF Transcript_22955/g.60658 Transcript_22955/m.60658 type:complete len:202 (+) Transcript_22955:706-1311(+)
MRWFSLEMLDFCCCSSLQLPSSLALEESARCSSAWQRSRSLAASSNRFAATTLPSSWLCASSILCFRASCRTLTFSSSEVSGSSTSSRIRLISASQSGLDGTGRANAGSSCGRLASALPPPPRALLLLASPDGERARASWSEKSSSSVPPEAPAEPPAAPVLPEAGVARSGGRKASSEAQAAIPARPPLGGQGWHCRALAA